MDWNDYFAIRRVISKRDFVDDKPKGDGSKSQIISLETAQVKLVPTFKFLIVYNWYDMPYLIIATYLCTQDKHIC